MGEASPIHLQSIGTSVLRDVYERRDWFTSLRVLDYARTFDIPLTDEAIAGMSALDGMKWTHIDPVAREWLDRTLMAILTPSPIAEEPKPAEEPRPSGWMHRLWGWIR